jgi:hypothetical protein
MCSYELSEPAAAAPLPAAPPLASAAPATERPLDELERDICELSAHLAAATCRWLLMIAEFEERGGWHGWGIKTCAHWLSWRCSLSLRTARQHLFVARRLRELPLVRERFARGELSYCKVRAIARAATPETEARLVELAEYASGAQLDKIVAGYCGVLAATLQAERDAHDLRHLSWSWDDQGSLRVSARLPADEGALLIKAVEAAKKTLGSCEDPKTTYEADPGRARDVDALMAVARASLDSQASQRTGGDPCELVVHVDVETLAAEEVKSCSEVEDGPALAAETARRLGCDAAVVTVLERGGETVSVGRRRRTITPGLRRALRRRDRGCRFPGCTHQRFLHAHHIQHWARGGATDLHNLVQLCSYHHRLVHEGGFSVECVAKRALRFRRPDGTVLPAPGPGRARGAGVEEQNRIRGVSVDDHTCMGTQAGARFDYRMAVDGLVAARLDDP